MTYRDKKQLITGLCITLILHAFVLFNPYIDLEQTHVLNNGKDRYSIRAKLKLKAKKVVIKSKKKNINQPLKERSFKQSVTSQEKTIKKLKKNPTLQKNKILSAYLYKVRQLVTKNKFYPFIAKKMGYEGQVDIKVIINANGNVLNSKVVARSEHEVLNQAALNIITHIKKFDPFPKGLNQDMLEVTLPVVYELVL